MSEFDELAHLIKHMVAQAMTERRSSVYGHIASYDPVLHRIKALVPSLRDDDDQPVLTPWMPLGTAMVGPGIGVQYAPKGGATYENPTGGEQCKITMLESEHGVTMSAEMGYTQQQLPPFPNMKAGEYGIKNQTGTFFYIDEHGTTTIDTSGSSGGKVVINSTAEIDITSVANINIKCPTLAVTGNITASGEITRGVGTSDSVTLGKHLHGGVEPGGGQTAQPTAQT